MFAPAFVPVAARQTLGHPSTQPVVQMTASSRQGPPTQATPARTQRQWPEPVRHYVQRAFAEINNIEGVERIDIEGRLKQVISAAAETNTLDQIDWVNLPLPQQMIQDERHTALMLRSPNFAHLSSLNLQDTNTQSPENPRKRKSGEFVMDNNQGDANLPPWRAKAFGKSLESRVSQPSKRQKNENDLDLTTPSKAESAREKRKQRFQQMNGSSYNANTNRELAPEIIPLGPVVGRNQNLEKKYLRLTAAPNPDFVRPLPVLEKTLDLLKRKWRQDNNYAYICDQFKSLRQDLTVQHIKTEFTVSVYEIHARIALEKGDMGEYNQCQTQLRALYAEKLGGHPNEFKAYRILYFLYTCNRAGLSDILADLTPAEKQESAIKHALDSRSALALGNYHRFFRLYLETPNMGAYLMDMFVTRERLAALANMCKAYKPDIKLRFVTEELGFESDADAAQFVCEHGGQNVLEERELEVHFLTGKAGGLFDAARQAAFSKVDLKGQI